MSNEVINFLEEIKKDYGWFLYSYDLDEREVFEPRRLNYPHCCVLSAQLISSFLYVHFSKDTKCIYDVIILPNKKTGYSHAWSTFNGEIVDFTYFQFGKFKSVFEDDTKISRQEFDDIMNQIDIFYTKENHEYVRLEHDAWSNFQEQELLAVDYAKKYNPTKEGFMKYLSEAIQIEEKIVYK